MESLHPMVIHFPIALLMAAFLVETLALVIRQPAWHRLALWNLVLGTLGTAVAVVTGRQAMAVAKHSYQIHQVMELHERLGYVVLGLTTLITVWRLFLRDRFNRRGRLIPWAILGMVCGIIAFSAHLGGRMVYEFGVGGSYGRSAVEIMVR